VVAVFVVGTHVVGGQDQKKRQLGPTDVVTLLPPDTVEGLWEGANLVVEAVAKARGRAFECNPSSPEFLRRPCTPTELLVKGIFKNESGIPVEVNGSLIALQQYGRVETDTYFVEDQSGAVDAFEIRGRHFVFLRCSAESQQCYVFGYLIHARAGKAEGSRVSEAIVELGATGVLERLERLKEHRNKK
jgi:hypothetical protein